MRSTKVYECINDPGAVSSILSNALTSSYFILSLTFICLSIILPSLKPPSPLVSTLLPCHPRCQNLPMLLSLNLTLVPSPFSSLFLRFTAPLISAPVRRDSPLLQSHFAPEKDLGYIKINTRPAGVQVDPV